jgi:hypothetical protein
MKNHHHTLHQVPSRFLLPLNRLKQTLEVPRAKPIKVIPLDNLNEHRRPIHQMLREQLQQVPTLIKINQDVQAFQHFKVLIERHARLLQPHLHAIVVRLRHLDKLNTSRLQIRNIAHDIVCSERNVLHTRSTIKVNILFYLRLLLALGGLVDGHLDDVVGRAHDDGLERRVLCADVLIVDTPEAMESQHVLVVVADVLHFVPVLVAYAVVDGVELHGGQEAREGVAGLGFGAVARQEDAAVCALFDQGVGCVAVGADSGKADGAVCVGDVVWCGDG